ncbi:MAG: polysaccharide deacetylase family protein [Pseudomonadota bacterium]
MAKVTLTFDNGPSVDTTPYVLEHLKSRGLRAYFCLIAGQLLKGKEQVDIANQTQADGHVLVNHSLTHGVALGDDPSAAHAEREVSNAHAILVDKLHNWEPDWFRPFGRGGEIGNHLLSEASMPLFEAHGYSILLWNSVPRDWEDVDGWVETAHQQIGAQDHTVVVLHDLGTGAMVHLARFLDDLLCEHEITMDLPTGCVPVQAGSVAWPHDQISQIITEGAA